MTRPCTRSASPTACRRTGTSAVRSPTTIRVTAAKDGTDWRIDVLDENFGQPYDYQWLLSQNPDFAYARRVAANVERELRVLADAGVLIGWREGMYV